MWAIEQDELSKRVIPCQGPAQGNAGQDVLVPWVLATQKAGRQKQAEIKSAEEHNKVFNRYYHMFSKGELYELMMTAAQELGLAVGSKSDLSVEQGLEIVQCGWERSNYYIEIRRWRR